MQRALPQIHLRSFTDASQAASCSSQDLSAGGQGKGAALWPGTDHREMERKLTDMSHHHAV